MPFGANCTALLFLEQSRKDSVMKLKPQSLLAEQFRNCNSLEDFYLLQLAGLLKVSEVDK